MTRLTKGRDVHGLRWLRYPYVDHRKESEPFRASALLWQLRSRHLQLPAPRHQGVPTSQRPCASAEVIRLRKLRAGENWGR